MPFLQNRFYYKNKTYLFKVIFLNNHYLPLQMMFNDINEFLKCEKYCLLIDK